MSAEIYDFVIVGGGPTGLALSTMLSQTDATIAVIERDTQLGGCWKMDWIDGKYYSEHSPRVMTTTYGKFKRLLKLYDIDFDHKPVYRDKLTVHKTLLSKLSVSDIFKLTSGLIISRFVETSDTVHDFMAHLSSSGAVAMYILSVAIANVPTKVMMQDVFDEMVQWHGEFVHLKDPGWYKVIEKDLSSRVDFRKGFDVQSINRVDDTYVVNTSKGSFKAKELILTAPPLALVKILENSDEVVKNNWGDFGTIKTLAEESSYHSIGFQLHFSKNVAFPKRWCEYCEGDWNIIILPVSEYLGTHSKDKSIKTVWSGCIIDQSKYSERLGKTPRECTFEELKSEIVRQLGVPPPDVFTFTNGIQMSDGEYISKDTGFVRSTYGTIKTEGTLPYLYMVGPVNHKGIVTMESAIQKAYDFIKNRYPTAELHKVLDLRPSLTKRSVMIIISIAVLIMLTRRAR